LHIINYQNIHIMRNLILISAIIASLILNSCDKVNELLTFTVKDEVSLTIENQFGINLPFEIPLPNVKSNSTTTFDENNTKADLVKDVSLAELKLSIVSPSYKTFSFLKSIHIYISAENIDEVEIAYAENISSSAQIINLTTTGAQLDDYLKAGTYSLRTEVTLRETLTEDVEIKVNLSFQVTADPF